MAIFLKFAPILLMVMWAWFSMRRSEAAVEWDLRRKSAPLDDPRLRVAVQRFRAALGHDKINVDIYDVPVINGLATAKGGIYLTRGLMEHYRKGEFTEDEIAGVIAHEIGHLALGHHEKRRKAWRIEVAVRAATQTVLPRMFSGLGAYVTNFISRLLQTGLSRKDEYEADAFAAALMHRSGFDPRAQISLLEKLDRIAEGRGTPISWLASHPPTPKRIAALDKAIEADHQA